MKNGVGGQRETGGLRRWLGVLLWRVCCISHFSADGTDGAWMWRREKERRRSSAESRVRADPFSSAVFPLSLHSRSVVCDAHALC